MNPDQLLAHYDRIADAPDAVARLRRFVLDLAVRGKLVEQDSGDEPAACLLNRIAAAEPKTSSAGALPPVGAEEVPFKLPASWCWSRVGTLCSKTGSGSTPRGGQNAYQSSGVAFLRSQNIHNDGLRLDDVVFIDGATHRRMSGTAVQPGDLLLNITGGSLGRCCRVPDVAFEANVSQHVAIIRPAVAGLSDFLHCLVLSPYFQVFVVDEQTGAGRGGLPKNRMDRIAVPLPPLAEQKRIVAKVAELMVLCDRLVAARAAREATRDRLAAASLARLNSPDPETFQSDARFALDTLPSLTKRRDQIKQLRQTILNLAVRGILVPQEVNDEPATNVLEKIRRERVGAIGNRRQNLASEVRSAGELPAPFNLPVGWAWSSFPELGTFGRGKSKHRPRNDPKLFDGGMHPLIQTGDVARSSGVITAFASKYNDFGLAQSMMWPTGTLCITIAANIADTGILGFDACFPDSVVGFVPAPVFASARYFEYFLRTAKSNLTEFAPATAQKNINLEILESVRVPLPPLAELHRIVAKVDELMSLCDQLEAALTTASDARRRTLEALLVQSLRVDD